jgi:hypothetical protein
MERRRSRKVPRPWVYKLHESVPEDRLLALSGALGRSNNGRGRPIHMYEIMELFDSLPLELREALANANRPWAPSWAHAVMSIGAWPIDAVISRIASADREEELQHELQLLRGEG